MRKFTVSWVHHNLDKPVLSDPYGHEYVRKGVWRGIQEVVISDFQNEAIRMFSTHRPEGVSMYLEHNGFPVAQATNMENDVHGRRVSSTGWLFIITGRCVQSLYRYEYGDSTPKAVIRRSLT